jgi:hypothetical protein
LPDTPYSSTLEGVFAEPTCTALLAIVNGGCDLAARLFVTDVQGNDSCPNPAGEARTFRLPQDGTGGETGILFAPTYHLSPSGECERYVERPTDFASYRAGVTPTEPDEWVDLVRDETSVTTGLAVSYWEGSDGSRFFDSYRLGPNGEPCEPFPPPEAGHTSYCISKRVLASSSAYTFDSCTPMPETLSTCDGGMAQISAYPELQVTLSGTGRLRTAYLTAEGQKLRAIGYHDTELNGPCHREVLEDGVAYCVGAGKFSDLQGGLFTDPACSRNVAVLRRDCSGQAASAVLTASGSTCSDTPLFLEHTEHEGPIYGFTFTEPVGCAEYPREEGVTYYQPGAPLAPGKLYAPYPDPL